MICPRCGSENPDGNLYCGDCGSAIRPQMPDQHRYAQEVHKPPLKLRVNIFCLVGAILGIIALFLPWAISVDPALDETIYTGAFEFDETIRGEQIFPDNLRYSVTLFLIGTLIAFLTPLGGIFQLIGSVGFMLAASTTEFQGIDMMFWFGAVMAGVSSAFVLMSLIVPIGVGFGPGMGHRVVGLLTWSAYR